GILLSVDMQRSVDGVLVMDDSFGNVTVSRTHQTYEVINNQAKVKTSESISDTTGQDGSTNHQDVTMTYTNNQTTGKLTGASGAGIFNGNDGFGNTTVGT